MHYRGKSFRFTARYPDGKKEILLDVPNYDFNWQNAYALAKSKLTPENTLLICEGVFDNSADNPANPDPTQEVRWGDQTWEEMMLGSFTTSLPEWIKPGEYPKIERIEGKLFKVIFRYLPSNERAKKVTVAGTFNEWNKEKNALEGPGEDGYYLGTLQLKEGLYEYKFVVDGSHWTHDPENPDRTGPFTNSALRVGDE